jgi:DNA-binding transcriptional regulator PaaX
MTDREREALPAHTADAGGRYRSARADTERNVAKKRDATHGESVARGTSGASGSPGWTFLSNHGHVLICLARYPNIPLRHVAARVGITERAVQRIVAELEGAGYLTRFREGRRNRYRIHRDEPLRHALERHHTVGQLLDSVAS